VTSSAPLHALASARVASVRASSAVILFMALSFPGGVVRTRPAAVG
jgi:hypothetical protein